MSFLGDQTSYMSICVGEGQDDSLSLLSAQELRQKVKNEQKTLISLKGLSVKYIKDEDSDASA